MLELGQAILRAKLARVAALRDERQTRSAQILFDTLDPHGWLRSEPPAYSGFALLRERFELERAYLLLRQERRSAVEEAQTILAGITHRVGVTAAEPVLDGEARSNLLADLAIVLSQIGDEQQAIAISQHLLAETGAPSDVTQIRDYVQGSKTGQKFRRRIAVQLNNLAIRRMKLAYIAALGDDRAAASDQLAKGHAEAEEALYLRDIGDEPGAVGSRLLSRANLVHVKLELAMLVDNVTERSKSLTDLRVESTAVVAESYETTTVRPNARLVRAAILGMVLLEQARLAKTEEATKALAWTALVCMQPAVDLYAVDADESVMRAVRYADACMLTGAANDAIELWQRTRDRLTMYRGPDLPALGALDARIEEARAHQAIARTS